MSSSPASNSASANALADSAALTRRVTSEAPGNGAPPSMSSDLVMAVPSRVVAPGHSHQMSTVEVDDLPPAGQCRLRTVFETVGREEGMTGVIVDVDVVLFSVLLERRLQFAHLFDGRGRILRAEQAEQWARQLC